MKKVISVLFFLFLTIWNIAAFIPRSIISDTNRIEPTYKEFRGDDNGLNLFKFGSSEPSVVAPITLLSGFLGVGKTTLLQNILSNREGLRIGMIVNDVASINIDSKLVRNPTNSQQYEPDTIELENGCVCCSISDELITSISQLVDLAKKRGYHYDHIVIEASGVAEPKGVRSSFQNAEAMNVPLMKQVRLDTMVTVIDAREFLEAYLSSDLLAQRPDLATKLTPLDEKFNSAMSEMAMYRPVVDLLVEQVECSDVVVINKMDTIDEKKEQLLRSIISNISPKAKILSTTFGKLPLAETLGCMDGKGVAESGVIDDHKDLIKSLESNDQVSSAHSHDHNDDTCKDVNCTDPSHNHTGKVETCKDVNCTDPSHNHTGDDETCKDVNCTDPSHNHTGKVETCKDVNCTDTSHDHSHSHSHQAKATTTAAERFGVTSFVYKAKKPFHPNRLTEFFQQLPLKSDNPITLLDAARSISSEGTADSAEEKSTEAKADLKDSLKRLVRSKGFLWLANSDMAAMYWSHAGRHFEVQCLGRWWASIPKSDWPKNHEKSIAEDFDGPEGDRRQELVFIGFDIDNSKYKEEIVKGLDQCLLDDKEWAEYVENRNSVGDLQQKFPSRIPIRFVM